MLRGRAHGDQASTTVMGRVRIARTMLNAVFHQILRPVTWHPAPGRPRFPTEPAWRRQCWPAVWPTARQNGGSALHALLHPPSPAGMHKFFGIGHGQSGHFALQPVFYPARHHPVEALLEWGVSDGISQVANGAFGGGGVWRVFKTKDGCHHAVMSSSSAAGNAPSSSSQNFSRG